MPVSPFALIIVYLEQQREDETPREATALGVNDAHGSGVRNGGLPKKGQALLLYHNHGGMQQLIASSILSFLDTHTDELDVIYHPHIPPEIYIIN